MPKKFVMSLLRPAPMVLNSLFLDLDCAAQAGQIQSPVERRFGFAIALLLIAGQGTVEITCATEPLTMASESNSASRKAWPMPRPVIGSMTRPASPASAHPGP